MTLVTVSPKYQIVIPKEIRESKENQGVSQLDLL
ncbi:MULTISPECIES: AbrB/MazE/SpoVT family DNA-binding domain-containing protein [unclassified Methylophaga]|jgi:AbrB family looped-hinge helix DNA binding protein|nr:MULTISPECIES: AbrB/MazE/SpoVT family DNA-binding domain-containing protein [unclassified Methylophaga]|tara:strand:- start:3702 stop:3803 length:102 start_codon:yes stop_codon:yes gene_type:complete